MDATEAFDLDTSKTCESMPAFPMLTSNAMGTFVDGKLVICGLCASCGYITQCYSIGPNDTTWQLIGNMNIPIYSAAAVEINDKLLIMGGHGIQGNWLYL